MSEKTLITAEIKRLIELTRECVALDCIGAIVGKPGTGKTTALLNLEQKYGSLGLPGRCMYFRCTSIEGATRGVKNLLIEMGMREGLLPLGMTLQIAIKLALKELRNQQIRVILLDEADCWSPESIQGVISMADICKQKGFPVALIFSGAREYTKWIATIPSALSRTLRVEKFEELTVENTLSVLREIGGEGFAKLAERVEAGEKEAVRLIKHIHKTLAGNWRRLQFFSQLHHLHKPGEITPETVEFVFRKMLESSEP